MTIFGLSITTFVFVAFMAVLIMWMIATGVWRGVRTIRNPLPVLAAHKGWTLTALGIIFVLIVGWLLLPPLVEMMSSTAVSAKKAAAEMAGTASEETKKVASGASGFFSRLPLVAILLSLLVLTGIAGFLALASSPGTFLRKLAKVILGLILGVVVVLCAIAFIPWEELWGDVQTFTGTSPGFTAEARRWMYVLPFIIAIILLLRLFGAIKKSGPMFGLMGLAVLVAVAMLLPWTDAWTRSSPVQTARAPVIGGSGCTESVQDIPLDAKRWTVPNCQLNFSVTRGVVKVKGTVGEPITVGVGQKISWPAGFRALQVWAVTPDAEITGALCPFSRPRWNGRCTS